MKYEVNWIGTCNTYSFLCLNSFLCWIICFLLRYWLKLFVTSENDPASGTIVVFDCDGFSLFNKTCAEMIVYGEGSLFIFYTK